MTTTPTPEKTGAPPRPKKTGGYLLVQAPGHPLAMANGQAYIHRLTLYARLGPGSHPCHWCGTTTTWRARGERALTADHVNHDTLDNTPGNLVPACRSCNSSRIGDRPATTPPAGEVQPMGRPSRQW
jgi:hypothetical protein